MPITFTGMKPYTRITSPVGGYTITLNTSNWTSENPVVKVVITDQVGDTTEAEVTLHCTGSQMAEVQNTQTKEQEVQDVKVQNPEAENVKDETAEIAQVAEMAENVKAAETTVTEIKEQEE